MNDSWQVFGHSEVKHLLDRQLAAGVFSHAYLFNGPEGIGKKMLAEEFAKKILQTQHLHNHPDFSCLDEPGEIFLERMQEFMRTLSFKPFAGAKKIAIINNAQNVNTHSGNALLKTLEEPSSSTIIILVAAAAVLPTIISRCQTFHFYPASAAQLQAYAQTQDFEASLATLSFGRVGRLHTLATNQQLVQEQKDQVSALQEIMSVPTGQRLLKVGSFAEQETDALEKIMQTWVLWLRFELYKKPELYKALQACVEAINNLKANQNKKLILQSLFLKI